MMVENFRDLLNFWECSLPSELDKRIYKSTSCGASISLYLEDGRVFHNGSDKTLLTGEEKLSSFTIQTIVEGSDETVDSDPFKLPCEESAIDEWVQYMEAEASYIWKRDNLDNEDYLCKVRIWNEEYGFLVLLSDGNDFRWESGQQDDIPDGLHREIPETLNEIEDEAIPFLNEEELNEGECIKRGLTISAPSGVEFKAWIFEHSDPDLKGWRL